MHSGIIPIAYRIFINLVEIYTLHMRLLYFIVILFLFHAQLFCNICQEYYLQFTAKIESNHSMYVCISDRQV